MNIVNFMYTNLFKLYKIKNCEIIRNSSKFIESSYENLNPLKLDQCNLKETITNIVNFMYTNPLNYTRLRIVK